MKKVASIVLNNFKNDSRVLKEALTLKKNHYHVEVVALHEDGLKEKEEFQGIKIHRIKLLTKNLSKKKPVQLIKYLEYIIKAVKNNLDKDIIHCHDLNALPIGYVIKLFNRNVKVVYDAHEFETERNEKINPLIHKLMIFLEKTTIKKADAVINVSESIANEYTARYNVNPIVIYNCPSYQNVQKTNIFREKYKIPEDTLIFLYQGSLAPQRGLDKLLETFKKFSINEAAMIFMGYGPLEEKIKKYALDYDNIFFQPAVSPENVLKYTSSADIGVSYIENNCLNYYYCLPNKFFEYAMCNLPILSNNLYELNKMIKKYDCGFVYDEQKVDLYQFIKERILTESKEVLKQKGNNASNLIKIYNWEKQEEKIMKIYDNLDR